MNFETAQRIFEEIRASQLTRLKRELLLSAIGYATIRVDLQMADRESRRQMGRRRGNAHDAFIDACNILSREMIKSEEDASWRGVLGADRKVIGDFACYIHCILGLLSR